MIHQMTKKRELYFNFRRDLKHFLFNEWVWFGVAPNNHVEYNENDLVMQDEFDWIFDSIIDQLAIDSTRKEIEESIIKACTEDCVGNLLAVNNVVNYLMDQKKDLQKCRELALEEQQKYPKSEINRIKQINDELDKYL